jgi:hypothetical protein
MALFTAVRGQLHAIARLLINISIQGVRKQIDIGTLSGNGRRPYAAT